MADLDSLNPEQKQAVLATEGPLLVLAGAGSGKTRVITMRIAHLLDRGVPPERILALSFTNKAAGEMKERVEGLCGKKAEGAALSTFHALGLRFLREEGAAVGLGRGFTILDEGDQLHAVRDALKAKGFDLERYEPKLVLARGSRGSRAASRRPTTNAAASTRSPPRSPAPTPRGSKAMNAVDFDDLIVLPWWHLMKNDEVASRWVGRFRYVMVDEYQDTNLAQLGMLKALTRGIERPNVCAVGDDDQSIYAFRGAVAANILGFDKHFPGARVIALTRNYRSTNNILRAANAVIRNNSQRHQKELWSENGDGLQLRYLLADDGDAEAHWVATDLLRSKNQSRLSWRDFAILYRTNAQSRLIEESIRGADIPYRIVGGTRFFDRKEVRDLVGYLRVIANPYDESAWRRIVNYPPRGIGDQTITTLGEQAQSRDVPFFRLVEHPPANVRGKIADALTALAGLVERYRKQLDAPHSDLGEHCRALIKELAFRNHLTRTDDNAARVLRRMENLDEVADALTTFRERNPQGTLADYLGKLSLDTRKEDDADAEHDEVSLMTLHGSKGLEFGAVYLVGCEEGFLPGIRRAPGEKDIPPTPAEIAEERRLMYVGITRAKRSLTLTGARKRLKFGRAVPRKPSRFIEEIPAALFDGGRTGKVRELTGDELQQKGRAAFSAMASLLGRGDE
ncbi:MAG: UvrD-helicase domain-containing protein [Myxococcales bacterium]|nr:UvrD-helicase domain-containing protein [Myxococcales bacterium]